MARPACRLPATETPPRWPHPPLCAELASNVLEAQPLPPFLAAKRSSISAHISLRAGLEMVLTKLIPAAALKRDGEPGAAGAAGA
eukprot:1456551-Rhodomonas_salina.1